MISTYRSPVLTVWKIFKDTLEIALQYNLTSVLKEHFLCDVAPYSTVNPFFEICSSFNMVLISKELKHRENPHKISYENRHMNSSKVMVVQLF